MSDPNAPVPASPSHLDGIPAPAQDHAEHHVPTTYAPRTGLKLALGASLLVLALGAGFFVIHRDRARAAAALENETSAKSSAPALVQVVSIKYAPTTEALTLPGDSRAWYQSTIYARVGGYLEKWFVDIGDKVRTGQVLATIETPELDAQLSAARAKLVAAEADVKAQEAAALFAKSTYDRWQGSPEGVVSEQERESKKAEYDSSLARLASSKAQVALNQAEVQSLEAFATFKQVVAPYDGVITGRRIDIGDLVSAGSVSTTKWLFSVAQDDKIRIFVDVPQQVASSFAAGTSARVKANDLPERTFEGKVARTNQAIDPASRTLKVEVDVDNPDLALLPGMYLQVSFDLIQKPLLQVPASALLFRAAGPQIAIVGDDGRIAFRDVVIAHDQGEMVELRSGVSPGQKVVLNLSSQVSDGDLVRAVELDKPAGGTPGAPGVPHSVAASAKP